MSFIVPGPCSITFNGTALETTKAGITIGTTRHDVAIQHDAGGLADVAIIHGGKSLIVSMDIIDVTAPIARQLLDGIFGCYSNDGAEAVASLPTLPGDLTGLPAPIGSLASDVAQALVIQERATGRVPVASALTWETDGAVLLDPTSILMSSTKEMTLGMQFILVPDAAGEIFQKVPTYISAV